MNSIELAKLYVANLQKVWKLNSCSAILENNAMVQTFVGAQANEVKLPVLSLDGLGDYSKSTGYPAGDVTMSWVTRTLTMDRGKKFTIDSVDNLEAMAVPMGNLLSEFLRTKVVPELDAYRFAKIAQGAYSGNRAYGVLDSSSDVLSAIDSAEVALDNAEVPRENRVLFITPQNLSYLKGAVDQHRFYTSTDKNIGREVEMYDGMQVVTVPTSRFYLGWQKSTSGYINEGSQLNFIIVHKDAVIPVIKHNPMKIWTPDNNKDADGYQVNYRLYHDCFIKPNREYGIYIHTVESYTEETVDTPTITVTDDNTASVKFTVAGDTTGASYYYTLDGTTPTSSSSAYSSQVTVTDTTVYSPTVVEKTIKVIGIKSGMLASEVVSKKISVVGSKT